MLSQSQLFSYQTSSLASHRESVAENQKCFTFAFGNKACEAFDVNFFHSDVVTTFKDHFNIFSGFSEVKVPTRGAAALTRFLNEVRRVP